MVINIRKGPVKPNNYYIETSIGSKLLQCVDSNSNLGIITDNNLNIKDHVNSEINKVNSMLGVMKRNLKHLDKFTLSMLYESLVRSHLKYTSSVWHHYKKRAKNCI